MIPFCIFVNSSFNDDYGVNCNIIISKRYVKLYIYEYI